MNLVKNKLKNTLYPKLMISITEKTAIAAPRECPFESLNY